ncbi:hypothetical protein KEM52_002230, partial [Ascosphaera acerosa]
MDPNAFPAPAARMYPITTEEQLQQQQQQHQQQPQQPPQPQPIQPGLPPYRESAMPPPPPGAVSQQQQQAAQAAQASAPILKTEPVEYQGRLYCLEVVQQPVRAR